MPLHKEESYIEESIKRAVAAGWPITLKEKYQRDNLAGHLTGDFWQKHVCDPLFWQALGKSEGWKAIGIEVGEKAELQDGWKYYWHSFIDHLAEDKPAEDFFKSLLNNK